MARRIVAATLLFLFLAAASFQGASADTADETVIQRNDTNDSVVCLQLRLQDLGYYKYKITGFFGEVTEDALKDFQKANSLTADGKAGEKTLSLLYSNEAKRWKVQSRITPPKPKPKRYKYGNYRDWYDYVNSRFKRGVKYKVVDFDTGISYFVMRVGGQKHADVAPATRADTDKMYITLGRRWDNWERRALIVYIGNEPIAASLYGEPHGSTGIPGNGMIDPADGSVGQVCIHFKNSKTHGGNHVDPGHQYQIKRAAGIIK